MKASNKNQVLFFCLIYELLFDDDDGDDEDNHYHSKLAACVSANPYLVCFNFGIHAVLSYSQVSDYECFGHLLRSLDITIYLEI